MHPQGANTFTHFAMSVRKGSRLCPCVSRVLGGTSYANMGRWTSQSYRCRRGGFGRPTPERQPAATAAAGRLRSTCWASWATSVIWQNSFKARQGWRAARADLDDALTHELADCLWSVLTLADCYDVDLEAAFSKTMQDIADHLESLDVDQPLD